MAQLPDLPTTSMTRIAEWSNFHHTIARRPVATYLTPGARGVPAGVPRSAAFIPDLNKILAHCMANEQRLCSIGSRWSLSEIIDPGDMVLDPGVWNEVTAVSPDWITEDYKHAAAARGGVPVIVGGGLQIRTLNQQLGSAGLALQVSGASDGHRIAGCIATGTHGSHLNVGAVHDTVRAVHLITGPNQALLLQPSGRNFTPELTRWFRDATGLPTQDVADDELFRAAVVALGGLGFVHAVVIETVPLYEWHGQTIGRSLNDPDVWAAIETLDVTRLGADPHPDYFSVIFSPFAANSSHGSFSTILQQRPATQPFSSAQPVQASTSTDLTRLLSRLLPHVDGGLAGTIIADVVAQQTAEQYMPGPVAPVFPGSFFGPTTLPEGNGRSSEVVVNHTHTRAAVRTVIDTLQREGAAGRHLLGGVGVRFAPRTQSLLGMNIHAMNTYIEFPSLGSADTTTIHRAIWTALRDAGVPFTCHWGQEHGMTAASVQHYFGERVDHWKAARHRLLPTPAARAVFTNPLLKNLGLG